MMLLLSDRPVPDLSHHLIIGEVQRKYAGCNGMHMLQGAGLECACTTAASSAAPSRKAGARRCEHEEVDGSEKQTYAKSAGATRTSFAPNKRGEKARAKRK